MRTHPLAQTTLSYHSRHSCTHALTSNRISNSCTHGCRFIGVGDAESQQFNALGYREQDLEVLGPMNVTNVTHMPVLADTVYIDKHPQPSHDQTTMPGLLQKYHGTLTGELTANTIPRMMQSGDVHIGVYDFGKRQTYFATGKTDAAGDYLNVTGTMEGMAYNQPFIQFDMDALLNVSRAV